MNLDIEAVEEPQEVDWVDDLITDPIRMKDGFAYPNEGHGWGFSFKDSKLTDVTK